MSVRLFQNRWLELMTFMPMKIFLPFWALILALVIYNTLPMPAGHFLELVSLGFLMWSVIEYLGHRFLFHLELKSAFGQHLIFIIHGNHHDLPSDPLRNMLPLNVTVPIAAALWFGAVSLFHQNGKAIFLGFLLGYVGYDFIHYACHQFPMKKWPFFRRLHRHHMLHHYAKPDRNFAVTAIFWDRICGTKSEKRRQS
ncbi:sterol desaturase family protein [Gluconobacter sphaericus]|nr:sterol desaturase family protein [Gluconobacter sphaericus]QQX91903.1 sterol desaturase family protein [Gluconobacter sphaericus]GEB41688.1 hypothetical protein GSP01_04700 [Gluconobacter sphaericus NBRC 12467]